MKGLTISLQKGLVETPLTTQDAEKDDGIFRVRMEKLPTKMTLEAGSRCRQMITNVNICKQMCPKNQ